MDMDEEPPLAWLRRALARIEPAALPPAATVDLVVGLTGVVAAAQAALVRAVGAADQAGVWASGPLACAVGEPPAGRPTRAAGARPAGWACPAAGQSGQSADSGSWLADRARLTWAAAAALRATARALADLPLLAEAFRQGDVSLDHVFALTVPLTSPARRTALAGPVEAELTAFARRAGPAYVRAAVDRWLRRADPAGATADADGARLARSLSLLPVPAGAATRPDGPVALAGALPAEDARALLDALAAAEQAPAAPGEPRSPARRRADALLTIARWYLATARALAT
jgi:hypothetical protein